MGENKNCKKIQFLNAENLDLLDGISNTLPETEKSASPNSKQLITPNVPNDEYFNLCTEKKEGDLIGYSCKCSNGTSFSSNENFLNSKKDCSYVITQDEVNVEKNVQGNVFKTNMGVHKYSDVSSLGSLGSTPLSIGTKPKVMNPVKNNFCLSSQIAFKESSKILYESVQNYEKKSNCFHRTYLTWKKERLETIKKLKKLMEDVHNDQLRFNKTNVLFKGLNVNSREKKNMSTSASMYFIISLAALVTDAASGITSIAQAFNLDGYMKTFAKIMEHDKEITVPLYNARSLCLKEYQNVEEVLRKYHSDAFGDTMANISDALSLEELWLDIKGGLENDNISNLINSLNKYFRTSLSNETLNKLCSTIHDYTDRNPSALKACESVGKVCYDICDTWGRNPKGTINSSSSLVENEMLLMNERAEVNELRAVADNEYNKQAKLESDIQDAIEWLQEEMKDVDNNFKELYYPC